VPTENAGLPYWYRAYAHFFAVVIVLAICNCV
jgi:hypothetical protein